MSSLGIYIHVPFCASRCGYCDFNTYVPDGRGPQDSFIAAALIELALARRELGDRVVDTVFFGGGTPSLIGAPSLLTLLDAVRRHFRVAADVEVTTEANPESVDPEMLDRLHAGGFTRISLGMQSAAEHVLSTLERGHTPGRAVRAAAEARAAGFAHVSLDLIYGTPGESDEDWAATLDAALAAAPDHLSAYGLSVEPGTALAAAVRRGRLPAPDADTQARRYEMADAALGHAGLRWYEISNWARDPADRCRHNLGYWQGGEWWGVGPGAVSQVGNRRWSNVRRPGDYGARLAAGHSPAAEIEHLDAATRHFEAIMLGIRTNDGIPAGLLDAAGAAGLVTELAAGRLTRGEDDRLRLTATGRLHADGVVRALTG